MYMYVERENLFKDCFDLCCVYLYTSLSIQDLSLITWVNIKTSRKWLTVAIFRKWQTAVWHYGLTGGHDWHVWGGVMTYMVDLHG